MKHYLTALTMVCLGLVLTIAPVSATSLIDESVASVTTEAAWAGRVEVLSKRVVKRSQFHFTVFDVKLHEVYKGSGQEGTIAEIEVPGGEFDGKVIQVTGAPMLRPGDMVVLFLNQQPLSKKRQATALRGGHLRSAITQWRAYEVLERGGERVVVRMGSANLLSQSMNGYSQISYQGNRFREERYDNFVGQIFDSLD